MKRVAVIKHSAASVGRLGERLDHSAVEWEEVNAAEGDSLPPVEEIGALVIMGGRMGAYETGEHSFLVEEMALARQAVDRGMPVLGICLGAQLLAAALGGSAYLADRPEVGAVPVLLTEPGYRHPIVSKVAGRRVFSMHQDTFDPPPGSVLLAYSQRFPQAFSIGSALGIQFHPETPNAEANEWAYNGARGMLERAGKTPDEFAAEMAEAEGEIVDGGHQLFDAWIAGLDG
ncbi:MAG: type 1 glutamine amidotransferase [bacterium]|nr:type 1 glutamine amidotransferase [bacterium]MDE0502345.1 type 1 glutamine amidotransferase [bacterium]